MAKLKYTLTNTVADWDEYFYAGAVRVNGGIVETDNAYFIENLVLRGFEIIDDDHDHPKDEKRSARRGAKREAEENERGGE